MTERWGPFDLSGRNALVTGGGHGIGEAAVRMLADAGAGVVVAELDEARGSGLAEQMSTHSSSVVSVATDVSDPDSCERAVQVAVEQLGSLDILVNNAGIYPYGTLQDLTPEFFHRVLAVNLVGLSLMTKAAIAPMIANGVGGSIVNLSSIDGIRPSFLGLYAYGASKAGVIGATAHMARELGPHGIRVNAIAPSVVMTTQGEELDAEAEAAMAAVTAMLPRVPLGRFAEPSEIASIVVFLASQASSYITGETIIADGGIHLA